MKQAILRHRFSSPKVNPQGKGDMDVLVIGCGNKGFGSVNVDLYPKDRTQCMFHWNPKKTTNFVLADGQVLPFPDKSFKYVFSSHVLEHIPEPLKAIKEMERVCNYKTILIIPSQFYGDSNQPTHLYTWNPNTLKNLLSKAFPIVETGYTERLCRVTSQKKGRIFWVNLLYKLLNIRTELWAVCSVRTDRKKFNQNKEK